MSSIDLYGLSLGGWRGPGATPSWHWARVRVKWKINKWENYWQKNLNGSLGGFACAFGTVPYFILPFFHLLSIHGRCRPQYKTYTCATFVELECVNVELKTTHSCLFWACSMFVYILAHLHYEKSCCFGYNSSCSHCTDNHNTSATVEMTESDDYWPRSSVIRNTFFCTDLSYMDLCYVYLPWTTEILTPMWVSRLCDVCVHGFDWVDVCWGGKLCQSKAREKNTIL